MTKLKAIILALGFLLLTGLFSGCTVRSITMTLWWENYVYVGYWEGKCAMGFCSRGGPKVQRCTVNDDNTVTCVQEEQLTALLEE